MFVLYPKGETYLVGFYSPKNDWTTIKRGLNLEDAEKYVHYMNGGSLYNIHS